ncbi:MAG: hypothetical protein ISR65_13980 [Bacteriovoracaceae bacterium]|nr:hypothetical protein [Bacteriovoracaceae bacterium]
MSIKSNLRTIILFLIICSRSVPIKCEDNRVALLINAHHGPVNNMVKLGYALLDLSDRFQAINPAILQDFLLQYGKVKIDILQNKCGLQAASIDYEKLCHYLTVDTTALSKTEQDKAQELFNELSILEKKANRQFFIKKKILGADELMENNFLVARYLQLARIAQVVERGHSQDSQALYGRSMLPAHYYFDTVLNDRQSAKIAYKLETELRLLKGNGGRSTRFVRSPIEYRLYNFTHILRAARVGLMIRNQFDQFADVNYRILEEFLLLHDQSKINKSPNFSQRYSLAMGDESISSKLFQNYGVDFSGIPTAWQDETKNLVGELNAVDKAVAVDFFRQKGLLGPKENIEDNPLVRKYLLIEKIADLVDRGQSPITPEEFGRPMLPAHTFFVKVLKDQVSATIAVALEYQYDRVVKGWSYLEQVPILRRWIHLTNKGYLRDRRYTGNLCVRYMMEIFNHNLPQASML